MVVCVWSALLGTGLTASGPLRGNGRVGTGFICGGLNSGAGVGLWLGRCLSTL